MMENRKIVFVGPSGSGKTTLKNVFFDMANPFKLLETSLEPTRGINSRLYSLFDLKLGVFDLAGQENQEWFNKDKEIFSDSQVVICVLDINSYLKKIFEFLENFIRILKDLNLSDCYIVILLHKIDLIDLLYLQHKLKAINEFLERETLTEFNLTIYSTSIAESFFLKTYDIFTEIFTKIFEQKVFLMDKSIFQNFRIDLEIILRYNELKKYRIIDLFHDFNLPTIDANLHLKRLEHLGFIEFQENSQNFQLTKRSTFFKSGLEKETDDAESKIKKILESFYLFSNLNQER